MEKNNEQQAEVVIKKVRPINYFAAVAVSLIVTVLLIGFLFLTAAISDQMDYNFKQILELAAALLALVLFICLPILVASRYRWKTVIATYLFQAIFLFLAVFVAGMIMSNNETSNPDPLPYYEDTPLLNGSRAE